MEIEIDGLAGAIESLTEKLHGIGLEIYHLNSTISSLKNSIDRLKPEEYEE